jgi:hypothetical protein
MNPNLMEQFLGPSTQFFRFNSNDISVVVTPMEKKTCLLTKRNVIATTSTTNATVRAIETSYPVSLSTDIGYNRPSTVNLKPQKSFVSSSNSERLNSGSSSNRIKCNSSSHAQLNDQLAPTENVTEQITSNGSNSCSSNSHKSITKNLSQSSDVRSKVDNGEVVDRDEQHIDDDCNGNENHESRVECQQLVKSEDPADCLIENHRKFSLTFTHI